MYSVTKKNWANIANVIMKPTMLAPTEVRERKKLKSIIGARTRSSITTKAASATAARANRPTIRGEPQCQLLPSTSASTSAVNPTVSAAMPPTSTPRPTVSSRDSRAANSVTASAPPRSAG